MSFFFRKRRQKEIDPDETFIDSLNISNLNLQQFEGFFEKPISLFSFRLFQILIFLIFFVFSFRLFSLQILNFHTFEKISRENMLRKIPFFAERGIIFDRNGIPLAWNEHRKEEVGSKFGNSFLKREYRSDAFSPILGYLSYPKKDKNGFYWSDSLTGEFGIEKYFDSILSGKNGEFLVEVDARGNIVSKNTMLPPIKGKNIYLTIDADIQETLFSVLKETVENHHFDGAAAAFMDIQTGELLAMVSYPTFSSQKMTNERKEIDQFLKDKRSPFLNRVSNGLYPPGSTIKPFIALAALQEKIIKPTTKIRSTGFIEIKNPYQKSKSFRYRDWKKGGHGLVDVEKAIAESVNTFFYIIGGGYKQHQGLGIRKIDKYLSYFGFGKKSGFSFFSEKEGVIPSPEWKKKHYSDGQWRIGDTYISSIGQFGFLVSPLQLLRSVASLANGGILLIPSLLKKDEREKIKIKGRYDDKIQQDYFRIIRSGMRKVVTEGTATILNDKKIPQIAAKTGTAQVGSKKQYFDSWIVGFLPYKKPRYAFVLLLEKGKKGTHYAASYALKNFFDLFCKNFQEKCTYYFSS